MNDMDYPSGKYEIIYIKLALSRQKGYAYP
jgi:hypothetical protein